MVSKISFFPVGCGDQSLIITEDGAKILVDMNIRVAAADPGHDTPNALAMLRQRLARDDEGRLYVDAFVLTHPDKDHCSGLERHFHLGPPETWSRSADQIFIREIWSSPMVFRRASRDHVLCSDALAFNVEARRRVRRFRDAGGWVADGDRILILGDDENGKTDDLGAILIHADETFSRINARHDSSVVVRLLGPHPKSDDACEEEIRAKNQSSVILHFSLMGDGVADAGRVLIGGDAEVAIWERQCARHRDRLDWLSYDILLAPHHCSWHSLSHDSWSQCGERAQVSADARTALGQARSGAVIIASSKPVRDDDGDPPCIRAKREYEDILRPVGGRFLCTGSHPSEAKPDAIDYEIGRYGPRQLTKPMTAPAVIGTGAIGRDRLGHG